MCLFWGSCLDLGLFWGIRLGFDPIWGVRTWIWPYFGGSGAESEGLDLDLNPFWGGAELGLGVLVWIWAYLEGPAWIWPYFGDTDLDLALFWGGPGLDLGPWIWAHLEGLGGGLEKFDSRSEKNFNPPSCSRRKIRPPSHSLRKMQWMKIISTSPPLLMEINLKNLSSISGHTSPIIFAAQSDPSCMFYSSHVFVKNDLVKESLGET